MGWSTNQKALQKREKEANKKKQAQQQKQEAKERQKWKDEVTEKKQQTAQQRQERRLIQLEKKQELKRLAQLQEKQLQKQIKKTKNKGQFNQKKLTQAEIQKRQEEALIESFQKTFKNDQQKYFHDENPNKQLDGYQVANTVEGALQILQDGQERHPQRRFKAAFEAYAEKRDKQIKLDYPKFKRSKRLQMMRKQFEKHPENPYNKKNIVAYNHNPKKQQLNPQKKEEQN